MEVLKTIKEVLAYNLREFRGNRTQVDVAESCKIPLRTYQHLEDGVIPKKRHFLASLAVFHDVPETRFFLDKDLIKPDPIAALEVLTRFVAETTRDRADKTAKSPGYDKTTKAPPFVSSVSPISDTRREFIDLIAQTPLDTPQLKGLLANTRDAIDIELRRLEGLKQNSKAQKKPG